MKHKCPNCGHEWQEPNVNQSKGGKARWQGMRKAERSKAASEAAKARWAKAKGHQ